MAKTNLELKGEITENFIKAITEHFSADNDVLRIASGQVAIPVVDSEGGERWVKIAVIIPKSEIENGDFDGYDEAESYRIKDEERKAKAKELAEKKAKKIAKDEAKRAEIAARKAEKEKEKSAD